MAISCQPADLVAASRCLCGIPSGKRELVMIYLLQQLAGLGNLTAAQLLDRAKCLCGLSEHDMKAIEVALLCTATGGVPPCPPCPPPGPGGCTYQDMQVAWTPANLKLGENIGFFTFGDFVDPIPNIVFQATTSASGYDLESNTQILSVSWPNLVSVDPSNVQGGYILLRGLTNLASCSAPLLQTSSGFAITSGSALTSLSLPSLLTADLFIAGNALLTSVSVPLWKPTIGRTVDLTINALDTASIDHILSRCVAQANYGLANEHISLNAGTNSAPSSTAPGSDYAILVGRGAIVAVNP